MSLSTLNLSVEDEIGLNSINPQLLALKRRHRRSKKRFLATLIAVEAESYQVENRRPRKTRCRDNIIMKILSIANEEPALFKRMYRLHVTDFFNLLGEIKTLICPRRCFVTTEPIDPIIKLCVALRFLAGGIFLDLSFGYEIPHQCVHMYVWETLEAINERIDNINFPIEDVKQLGVLEQEFAEISCGRFRGTVAACDGVVFKMEKPRASDVDGDVISFYTRKGYYGFGMQGFASAKCKFLAISSKLCSSSHDSTAYSVSEVAQKIESGLLPSQYHIVMDEAYPCKGQVLSPFKGKKLSKDKDAFNYYLSLNRQVIERAFGILIARWGIFWRPLRVAVHRIPLLISVCCKLHNICIDRFGLNTQGLVYTSSSGDTDIHTGSVMEILFTDNTGIFQGYRSDLEQNELRDEVCAHLVHLNAERPERSVIKRIERIQDSNSS